MGQSRGIVDSVTDHGRAQTLALEFNDLGRLVLGQNPGDDLVNPGLSGYGTRGGLLIAGEHDQAQPHGLHPGHGLWHFLLELIGNGQQRRQFSIHRTVQYGLALGRESLCLSCGRIDHYVLLFQ